VAEQSEKSGQSRSSEQSERSSRSGQSGQHRHADHDQHDHDRERRRDDRDGGERRRSGNGGNGGNGNGNGSGNGSHAGGRRRLKGSQAAVLGAQQLVELTGKDFEGIVGFTKDDDGWLVQVEVVEMRRVPNSTDVLATYEVSVDSDGDLDGYRRLDRYMRGSSGEDRR
jgi:hypothetical protein